MDSQNAYGILVDKHEGHSGLEMEVQVNWEKMWEEY